MFLRIVRVLLLTSYRRQFAVTFFASAVSGACAAATLALINYALSGGPLLTISILFAVTAGGKVIGQSIAQTVLNRLCQDALFGLREELARATIESQLDCLERVPPHKVCSAMTADVTAVADALNALPTFVVNVVLMVSVAAYLGWLSPVMLLALLTVVMPGIVGYRILRKTAFEAWKAARAEYQKLVGLALVLAEGGKELRLYRGQRDHFIEEDFSGCLVKNREHNLRAQDGFILLDTWTQFLFYLLIGVIVFVIPGSLEITALVTVGSVLVVLFLMRPLITTMSALPVLNRGGIALAGLESLREELSTGSNKSVNGESALSPGVIELVNAHYFYPDKGDGFRLGPLKLTLAPGEVVIVAGGNGSGKSTLAKIVTGLYPLTIGEVRLGGQLIDEPLRDDYRQLFAAVFTGSHIFDRLPGKASPERDRRVLHLLDEFRLAHRIQVEEGRLNTMGLSHGERQRLALLQACLEDRPFFVLDEGASHQDPEFKQTFYMKLLPELKQRGKGVLVISHDDRYFAIADRVIWINDGVIIGDQETTGGECFPTS